jgi:hypothetical protein
LDRLAAEKNKKLDDELSIDGKKTPPSKQFLPIDDLDLRAAEKNKRLDTDTAKFRELSSQATFYNSSLVKKPPDCDHVAPPVRPDTSGKEMASLTNVVCPQIPDHAKNRSVHVAGQLAALRLSDEQNTELIQFENEEERQETRFSVGKRPVENEVVSPVQLDLVVEEAIDKRKDFPEFTSGVVVDSDGFDVVKKHKALPDFMSSVFSDDEFDDGNTAGDDITCLPQAVNKQLPAPTQPSSAPDALCRQAAKCSASDAGGTRGDDAGPALAKEDERRVAELERIKASLHSSLEK